ncbi:hypothetical protein C2845_PM08G12690 [Panicum miliaceum]|uniref:Uncharacterized protein n=1 Tax=Panicum miliaceum TaxID=4540 RepID=A0A3L6QZV0_PANMI|nr:hypothetical protein C2845_PM08G12690 [Panicum miliaceum]
MAAASVPAILSARRAYQLLLHLPHTPHTPLDPLNRTNNDRNIELPGGLVSRGGGEQNRRKRGSGCFGGRLRLGSAKRVYGCMVALLVRAVDGWCPSRGEFGWRMKLG